MHVKQIEVVTSDGAMPTFIARPEGEGPFPVALVLMDGLGFREALQGVARRLAEAGYYAMLPDLFYRAGLSAPIQVKQPGGWEHMLKLVDGLSDEMVIRDAEALLERAEGDPAARAGAACVMGFCMGGRLSVVLSQALGERVCAAAAIHPGNLVSEAANSTHRHVDRIAAELYLAIADRDEWCTPDQVSSLQAALSEQGVRHEVEWHPGALHGFGVPGGDSYHEEAAERVWKQIEALFARALG